MLTFWKWALILAVPTLLVAADEPSDQVVPNDTTIQLILLRQKSVQEELKLNAELVTKVLQFTNGEYEAWQNALKLSQDEREQKIKELQKKNQDFLADNFNEGQRKRLRQIMLQVTGLMHLTRPAVVKELNLTEEQQQKFKELQKETGIELQEIIDAKKREGRNEKLAKLRDDIDKKVEAILTDQQKDKVKELVGERFKGAILLEEPESALKDK
jgi:hypothetical protein